MTKEELIKEVGIETGYSNEVITEILESITTTIGNTLISGEDVSIFRFGVFKTQIRKGRNIRNISTGKNQMSKDVRVIKFQPTRELKEAIKDFS